MTSFDSIESMSGTLSLTPQDHAFITASLLLEHNGFAEAAKWLRTQIKSLPHINWDEPLHQGGTDTEQWATLFRAHRGSVPPIQSSDPVIP